MSASFTLKPYQRDCLAALRNYLAEVATTEDADTAFYKFTRRPYQPVEKVAAQLERSGSMLRATAAV